MDPIPEELQRSDQTHTSSEGIENEGATEDDPGKRGFLIKALSLGNMEPLKRVVLKIELNGKPVGKSEEIFIQDREVVINWETFYEMTEVTKGLLEEIITNPLVFTVLCENVLPLQEEVPAETKKGGKGKKEKGKGDKSPSLKSKSLKNRSVSNESKKTKKSPASSKSVLTNPDEGFPVLGVANLDMIPILLGQSEVEELLYLNPTTEPKGSEAIAWETLPKLKVLVSTTGNVLDEIPGIVSNILSFTLESLHNISPNCNENVEVATILPSAQVIRFTKGTLLLDNSVWVSKRKKWFGLVDLLGQGALSPFKVPDHISNLLNTMDLQVTDNLLVDEPRIQWNQLHRSLLDTDLEATLKEQILEFNCWPVEILIPSSIQKGEGKKKGEKVTDGKSDHYITFLDLSKLIYPGEKSVRLTSQLYHYTPEIMKTRFGTLHVLFDEITSPDDDQDAKSKASSSKKGSKAGKAESKKGGKAEKAESKKSSQKSKKGSLKSKDGKKQKKEEKVEEVEEVKEDEPVAPKEPEPVLNDDGEPIFIIAEVELLKPLVKKRDEEKVLESIYKIIPKREKLTAKQLETINAMKLYEDCIKSLIHNIHDEYQIFFNANEPFKNSCKNFLMHLHVTGSYAKMAESMRQAVTAHVRQAVGPADTWEEMKSGSQNQLTNIYQDMSNKMYTIVSSYPDPSMEKYEPEVTCENLQYFEAEAMEEGDDDKAHYYLLQRLEKSEKADPQVWVEFAAFWKKKMDFDKAEECVKEAISLDPRHINALLFHGLLSWLMEDFDVAEMFLLAVVTFSPRLLEGWVILHMLHKQMGKQKEASAELLNAKDCISPVYDLHADNKSNLYWCGGVIEGDRIFLLTGSKLLSFNFPEFTEVALSYDLLLHGRSINYLYYLAVCHYQQARYLESLVHLEEVLKMHWEDDRFWALKGHNYFQLGQLDEAKKAYHVALNFKDQEDQHLINLRLGKILMMEGDYRGARDNYLLTCRDSPTPMSWLGLGITAFVSDDIEEAELALSEANMLDCRMGRVWGYLAIVNLMMNRPLVFNRCIQQAYKYGFEDDALEERIDHLVKLVQPIAN